MWSHPAGNRYNSFLDELEWYEEALQRQRQEKGKSF
jgi:hypothetical protein